MTVSARTKSLVWKRAGGNCERCGQPLGPGGYSYHHRRIKGMGGDRRPDTDQPGNLVLLCGSGTSGCHGWVHDQGQEAARKLGWLVSRYADPLEIPVPTEHYGWVLLNHEGWFSPAEKG